MLTCTGTWPAMWMFSESNTWPAGGEIDIIEGVNSAQTNQFTLHTSSGCSFSAGDCGAGDGTTGCPIKSTNPQTYGSGFNAIGGGVYAVEWTSQTISIWFFPRTSIPSDIASGSPDPTTWGAASAQFSGSGCDIDQYFSNNNIVFNVDLCGSWAGAVWGEDATCSKLASTCEEYVAANPSAFADAYWLINSVKVYQPGASTTSGSSTTSSTDSAKEAYQTSTSTTTDDSQSDSSDSETYASGSSGSETYQSDASSSKEAYQSNDSTSKRARIAKMFRA
jgi:hypothetical protein